MIARPDPSAAFLTPELLSPTSRTWGADPKAFPPAAHRPDKPMISAAPSF